MTDPATFRRVAELFESARDQPAQDRDAFFASLDETPEVIAEVHRLLARNDGAPAAIDTPVLQPCDRAPKRIGTCRIVRELGRGGMGVVYLAAQDKPQRTVAVKVIRAGFASRELLRRFDLEAAMLGRLQHPGIAQIYEVGADDRGEGGRPYFVMEYVDGAPLLEYARRLGTEARLELLAKICDAVEHAHQRGVIHRDLKPGNILVDQTGRPKILDFGVARATDSDLQLTTIQTNPGQLIGTVAYMSPEQVTGRSSDIDTRSDVYALGVVLYELLADRLPYDLDDLSVPAAAQVIAEREPTSLTTVHRSFRGDLDTIVRKALEKDADRRYQSAAEFGADLRRSLADEPIVARPASTMYQLRKFARRNRALVTGVATAFVVLIAATIGLAWQSAKVTRESEVRREVAAFLDEMLTSLDPAKTGGAELTVRDMLDDAAVRLEERFDDAPAVRADLHQTVGTTYYKLGEYERADGHLGSAARELEEVYGIDDERTLDAIGSYVHNLCCLDRPEEAESIARDALDRCGHVWNDGSDHIRTSLAWALSLQARPGEALEIHTALLEHRIERLGPDHQDTLSSTNNVGQALMSLGRSEDALPYFETSLERQRALFGVDDPRTIRATYNYGGVLMNVDRIDEAAPLMAEAVERSTRVLGPDHLFTMQRRMGLIQLALRRGEFAQAQEQSEIMLAACEPSLGTTHPTTLQAAHLLTAAVAFNGSMEGAERIALDWFERVEQAVGSTDHRTGRMAMLVYDVYDSWGKPEQMATWLERARATEYQIPGKHFESPSERPMQLSDYLAYRGVAINDPAMTTWGSSPIVVDDRYYLFTARWPSELGVTPGWRSHSEIARFSSDSPLGPFEYEETVLAGTGVDGSWEAFAPHNPTIKRFDGTFALFYIARTDPSDNSTQRIGLATAPSITGPWTRRDAPILSPSDSPDNWTHASPVGVTNPAPLRHPDGRYFLYFKSRRDGASNTQMGVAIADGLEGPYVIADEPITNNDDHSIEDGYAFVDADGLINLMTTDNHGILEFGGGLLWTSKDGLSFDTPTSAFHLLDRYLDRSDYPNARHIYGPNVWKCERPQLLIEDGRPRFLYAPSGVSLDGDAATEAHVLEFVGG